METDPLQQLRDVHLPADPGMWPLAPGWWLLMLLGLALLLWAAYRLWQAYRRRRPIRAARRHLVRLQSAFARGEMTAMDYVTQANRVLKRLLVRGLQQPLYAPLSGAAWLRQLDQLAGGSFFADGPGQVLGDVRFQPGGNVDAGQLHAGLLTLLRALPRRSPAHRPVSHD